MTRPYATLIFLLTQSLTLSHALPPVAMTPRTNCASFTHIETPFAFWQIFQETSRQNETSQLGPKCIPGLPYCDASLNDFHLSQDGNAANQHDLVASYRNQNGPPDTRCGIQELKGPYTLEFQIDPSDVFSFSGTNKRIDVFEINGDIPQQFDGHREYYSVPNWNNIGPLTGALVGSVNINALDRKKSKLLTIVREVQETCRLQFNFRLSFSDSDNGPGMVDYVQMNTTGLRMTFGC